MKRKFNYIDDYEDIKKKRTDIEIDKLDFEIKNISLHKSFDYNTNDNINNTNDNLLNLYNVNTNVNDITNITQIHNEITKKINFLHENSKNNTLTFDLIILISNNIINQIGKDKFIEGNYDNLLEEQIFNKYISLLLYPTYLFRPYVFDDNFSNLYVSEINVHLKEICYDSKCFFPTWKKKYNYDIDYNFFSNVNQINKRIYKNFTKKIFDFYEKLYYQYFNILFGNLFSFILLNYKINLNPYDKKFNKSQCLEWIDGFNIVLKNCYRFIKNYANLIELEKIDELDKDSLEKKINRLNNSYINILNNTNKDLQILFEPLKKFYKSKSETNNNTEFVNQVNCLIDIKKEIDYIFKLKNYVNLITKSTWVKNFYF